MTVGRVKSYIKEAVLILLSLVVLVLMVIQLNVSLENDHHQRLTHIFGHFM